MFSTRTSLISLLLAAAVTPLAAVTLNQFNIPSVEDFDTLGTAAGSVVPPDWQFIETGTGANTTYAAGTGSSNLGNTYSFGATGSTDRAFGSVKTSSVATTIGTFVTNDTGSTIDQLTIQFTGEQWRLGALGRVDRLDFAYSMDGTSIGTGIWLDVDDLDFTGPVTTGIAGALDGNAAENQLFVSHTFTGLNLLSGTSLWLRWSDFEASGSDDGLALDNFSITAVRTVDTGGGGEQNVPDDLPTGVIAAAMGAVLVFAKNRNRIRLA
jgi:uncharacterized protein